ncbi:sterol desaturase family protein [Belliella sp. R4-6]|uniref:Sterol desaturase family protein n=1 Tax=Belliella alkalica TaxID=1730871 RepID=A0ABS9VF66_9BACT|nr:sterol desaturase family protein [Belliella alkalica]MCH7415082.1 sterol desaturase family protein [Belliella alkalica]
MELLLEKILYQHSYLTLFGLTVVYFSILYFGLGPLFLQTCKFLEKKNILQKITAKKISKKQLNFEIRHSIKSIIIFGFSVLPIIYLIRVGAIQLLANTWINITLGLIILTLWNEVHFYVVHRLMHQKLMMKHVHYIHHKSTIPTVYSVYSFHWLEAALLSTIPLTIVPFIPFSIVAVFIYPTVSILLNFAGHCNYRFGSGKGDSWQLFGTAHNEHHTKGRNNFGFALNFLDKLFSKPNKQL